MFRFAVAVTVLGLTAIPAFAMEVLKIAKGAEKPWAVGDTSETVTTGDGRLGITLTVKKSPNSGQSYYVLSFETLTSMPVNFSARVSDRPLQRTHFAARAEPGRPYKWGEHLPEDLDVVYVLYRASK